MRHFCPRLTVRRMMFAVAVLAALVWSAQMARRSYDYRRQAEEHAELEQRCEEFVRRDVESVERQRMIFDEYRRGMEKDLVEVEQMIRENGVKPDVPPFDIAKAKKETEALINEHRVDSEKRVAQATALVRWDEEWVVYHRRLKGKYQRAMWAPWRLVTPDPPVPARSPDASP
jgi:hypothetical protein